MLLPDFKKIALASAITSALLAGCGGGGGGGGAGTAAPSMLSGTVAGGAAVIGSVIVTDSLGATKGGTIEADGHYAIDVSGMSGPFVLKASGTVGNSTVTYYSAATVADIGGTVNVTPFTNLIVSNIAGQLAETYFSDPDNIAKIGADITPAALAAAETALQAKLEPVLAALGISDTIDLLHSTFAADHSGVDAVLDLVRLEVNSETQYVELKNALTQAVIATDDPGSSADDDTPAAGNMAGITTETVTDLQAIVTKLNGFADLFANGLPSVKILEDSGVFDTSGDFMMGGHSFAEFATQLSTEQEAIGLKFSNVAIALDAAGTSGNLTAMISSNTATFSEKIELVMIKVDGVWKVQGDGRIADISIHAQAQRNEWTTVNSSQQVTGSDSMIVNGLAIWIDPFSYNASHSSAPVVSALVTGPGLGNGINFVQDTQNTWLKISGTNSDNLVSECGTPNRQGTVVNTQCVTVAQALDNSEYTVVLKDAQGASLNGTGYKLILPKQPYSYSALTASNFPTLTSLTIDGQSITPSLLVSGKSVLANWTLPSGLFSHNIDLWANTNTGADYFRVEKKLMPSATSALIGLGNALTTGTVSNAGIWLNTVDGSGRRMALSKSLSVQVQ